MFSGCVMSLTTRDTVISNGRTRLFWIIPEWRCANVLLRHQKIRRDFIPSPWMLMRAEGGGECTSSNINLEYNDLIVEQSILTKHRFFWGRVVDLQEAPLIRNPYACPASLTRCVGWLYCSSTETRLVFFFQKIFCLVYSLKPCLLVILFSIQCRSRVCNSISIFLKFIIHTYTDFSLGVSDILS